QLPQRCQDPSLGRLDRRGEKPYGARTEVFELEAQRAEVIAVIRRGGRLRRLELDGLRQQQGLAGRGGAPQTGQEAVVEHALVGGVLVDQDHAASSLGDQIPGQHLAKGTQRSLGVHWLGGGL